jgi:hypothetical protein
LPPRLVPKLFFPAKIPMRLARLLPCSLDTRAIVKDLSLGIVVAQSFTRL